MLSKENIKIQNTVYNMSSLVENKIIYIVIYIVHIYYVYMHIHVKICKNVQ